jgi:hypothetical protein
MGLIFQKCIRLIDKKYLKTNRSEKKGFFHLLDGKAIDHGFLPFLVKKYISVLMI